MKRNYRKFLIIGVFAFLINTLSIMIGLCQSNTRKAFEAYYLKVGDYPTDMTNVWNPNGTETQGVTHDQNNWYFTTTDHDEGNARLWRIPVSVDLISDVRQAPGHSVIEMLSIQDFVDNHNWHWGDPDHYKYNGVDYICVPITGGPSAIIAVFQSTNLGLNLVAYSSISIGGTIGWCAVTPTGDLVTSLDDAKVLERFEVKWDSLQTFPPKLYLIYKDTHQLLDASGLALNDNTLLHNMQGGEFTPSGELLYISCGAGECWGFGDGIFPTDGIHVFETTTWQEIKRSINPARGESGYFDYRFDNGCTCTPGWGSQTPEGLTIWDLDDGRAPKISGQLHILVNFYNRASACDDGISLQHFGGKIIVDATNGFPPLWTTPFPGTAKRPFNTVKDALSWYPAWDGAQIVIKAWSFHETGTFSSSSRVELVSEGGVSTLGGDGSSLIGVQLFEHPNYQGTSRFFTSDVPDLDLGTINFADVASSVRLYNLSEAQLYDGNNYGGGYLSVTQDIPDLTPLGWNDRVGSLKIIP